MEYEKKYFGGWWMWVLLLLVASAIILGVLNYVGIFGKTVVERKVFENSYQKKAADKDARSAYDAQLQVLRRRLNSPDLTDDQRAKIQGQIDSINILKASKEN